MVREREEVLAEVGAKAGSRIKAEVRAVVTAQAPMMEVEKARKRAGKDQTRRLAVVKRVELRHVMKWMTKMVRPCNCEPQRARSEEVAAPVSHQPEVTEVEVAAGADSLPEMQAGGGPQTATE